jgi:TatD related DNase
MNFWQIADLGLTISRRSQTFLYGTLLFMTDPSTSYRTSGRWCWRERERLMVRSNIFGINAVLSSPLAHFIFYAMQDYGIFDCHAHLHEDNFPPDSVTSLEIILGNARKANIQTIVSVSEGLVDAPKVLRLAAQSNGLVLAGVGLHPVQTYNENDEQIERSVTLDDFEKFLPYVRKCIDDKRICCVGEGMILVYCSHQMLKISDNFHFMHD